MLHDAQKGDVAAIHRTRVASRRLREVLPVLQLDAEVARKLSRRLRKVTERLGSIRELDVLIGVTDEISRSDRYNDRTAARVATMLARERDRVRARLLSKISGAELGRLAAKLNKIAGELELSDSSASKKPRRAELRSWRWAIDARVARRASTLSAAVMSAGALYVPERLHAVRIAGKKLRYALELSSDVSPVKQTAELRQLRRVQNTLGRLHDLQVLIDRARQLQTSMTPPDVTAWRELDTFLITLENECRRLHGRYVHDAPTLLALCPRLAGRSSEVVKQARGRL